jgi:hypothetical protein
VRGVRQLKCIGDLENKCLQAWVPEVQSEFITSREQNGRDFLLAKSVSIVW